MFYLYNKENPWNFEWRMSGCEWRVHSHEEGKRWGNQVLAAPLMGAASPLLYIEEYFPLPTLVLAISISLLPLLHLLASAWRSHGQTVFSTTPHRRAVGDSRGSTTSAAPLDRGNGGRRQAVRVTECGSAAGLQRSSSRS